MEQVGADNGCNVREHCSVKAEVKDSSQTSLSHCAVWSGTLADHLKTRADLAHNGNENAWLDSWVLTSLKSVGRTSTPTVWSSSHHGKDAGGSATLVRSHTDERSGNSSVAKLAVNITVEVLRRRPRLDSLEEGMRLLNLNTDDVVDRRKGHNRTRNADSRPWETG
ncbi:hypothetical protein Y032_0016g3064 [Ancylostoma ceylanicum]|uniref:Uncharacterized protein n=1 Tax=Ancylostoma ceylanicum TaxID=53326 RepID=A0A016V8E9_9BILA|nr:hypothetical protein Y032_0016g3064 [Ancylostoma ceylanicum]